MRTYLHVSVHDFQIVQRSQSSSHLNEDLPDELLLKVSLGLLVFAYFLEDVPIVGELNDDAWVRSARSFTYQSDWLGSSIKASL